MIFIVSYKLINLISNLELNNEKSECRCIKPLKNIGVDVERAEVLSREVKGGAGL
jgi:hypothetical protein